MPTRSVQAAPPATCTPAARPAATVEVASDISPERALAVTSVRSAGSRRGVTEALTTPPAFCSTRMPNAAGSSVTELATFADMA